MGKMCLRARQAGAGGRPLCYPNHRKAMFKAHGSMNQHALILRACLCVWWMMPKLHLNKISWNFEANADIREDNLLFVSHFDSMSHPLFSSHLGLPQPLRPDPREKRAIRKWADVVVRKLTGRISVALIIIQCAYIVVYNCMHFIRARTIFKVLGPIMAVVWGVLYRRYCKRKAGDVRVPRIQGLTLLVRINTSTTCI